MGEHILKMEYDFGVLITDCQENGFKVSQLNNVDVIEDDRTNSFRSWNISAEEIEDELYSVWRERIKEKRFSREAFMFERNLGYYIPSLAKSIKEHTWRPKGYFDFKVYHPERIISAPYYKDRIVEQWLTDKFIKPYVEPKLHSFNVACRENHGPPKAQKEIYRVLNELYKEYGTNFWYLQCDISKYYDNLSHTQISQMFNGMEELGYILFMNIINNWKYEGENAYALRNNPNEVFGVPKGNLPSQWVGLMYLNNIDWYISGRQDCLGYIRYADDLIAFFHTKTSCKDCKIKIEKFLSENDLGVKLHPRKTHYSPITQGFTFCGWRYSLKQNGKIKCLVKNERKKVIKKNRKRIAEAYYKKQLTQNDVIAKLNGTTAFLNQGDTKKFQRYLKYRYCFTRDESKYKKDRTYLFKKKHNKTRRNDNEN